MPQLNSKNGNNAIMKNLFIPWSSQAPIKLSDLRHISIVNIPWTIVPIMKIVAKCCGCTKTKLANDVKYAIFRFVLFKRNIKRIPRKKNSSVNASKKLIVPVNKSKSKNTPLKYWITNVTASIISMKRMHNQILFFVPSFLMPNCPNFKEDLLRFNIDKHSKGSMTKSRNFTAIYVWGTNFYNGARGALFLFDLTNKETLEDISIWINEAESYCEENFSIVILGNKKDLEEERTVTKEMIDEFLTSEKRSQELYMETSALYGDSVFESFQLLGKEIIKSHKWIWKTNNVKKIS